MNSKPVTVVAGIEAKPGYENQVRKELLSLVEPSRKDAGCLQYDLHQAADNRALFMFYENWASQADLERHLQKPDLQATLARVKLLAKEPQILLWEKIA